MTVLELQRHGLQTKRSVFVERDEKEQSEVVALAIDGVAPERQRHFTTQALDLVQT
ncbi:MAG: hypothetical protein ACXVR9_15725 [Gaiellaceae bacterium]